MAPVSFSDLTRVLANSAMEGLSVSAFAVPRDAGFFVDPVLVVREDRDDLNAEVILISARGAAGKSRTAAELAYNAKAPLWRLEADAAVGQAALPLRLNSYLESVDALQEIAQRETRPTLLIDSMDEARARVSAQSWEDFLDSIADAASKGLRVVLFGRDRTLEEVWLKFEEDGRSVAWLEVSHFPAEARREYIDGRVRDRAGNALLEGANYEEAREALLNALAGSIDDASSETFVGYAPVLDAVVAVLAEERNHYKLAREFEAQTEKARHIDVLRSILVRLLERDQGKLQKLAEELGLDGEATYTPSEQIDWLWHDIEGLASPDLSFIADESKRYAYEQGLRSFLDDHPFRAEKRWASVVFEAYAAAARFEKSLPADVLTEVGNRSGLFFDFVATANATGALLDEWQFAALHSSILAGESEGSAATVAAAQDEDGLEGRMAVNRPSGPLSLDFTLLPEDAEVVSLVGPLASLTLTTPLGLRVPDMSGGRVLGPDLFLRADSIVIDGEEARFARASGATAEEEADIRFEVTGESVTLPGMISLAPATNSFELATWPTTSLVYPWTVYRSALELDEEVDAQSKAIRFLNKLQNLARTHGHKGGRATFFMKLQGRQPIKSGELKAVLNMMEQRGVVQLDGDLVFLTADADKHRFNGKGTPGQQTIQQQWAYWGPVVEQIEEILAAKA
ncbi:hypothetical protein [Frigoribacterium sp. Leaf263]|uniref:hypothetical protein n=1 Tax=Frigoribacterium sp. Leaf263 TaxID=1736313 RepID=UPI000AAEACF3|nr:hypothetical protein [Frigoribacterium sp. Leaf263]